MNSSRNGPELSADDKTKSMADAQSLIATVLLLNNVSKEGLVYYIILLIVAYNIVKDRLPSIGHRLRKKTVTPTYSYEIEATEYIRYGEYRTDYPTSFLAISQYVKENGLCENFRQTRFSSEYFINYDTPQTIKISNTICMEMTVDRPKNEQHGLLDHKIIHVKLISTKSVEDIISFITSCEKEYSEFHRNANKDKLFHFIYRGCINDKLEFCSSVISDISSENEQNYETFDNIFNEHKSTLIHDIDQLKDIEYYKKTGLKRKKGYLFAGHPGCGKTSSVMAMANYDRRHIIEIPFSRLKTVSEFERILCLTKINEVQFKSHQVIILFDEIDKDYDVVHKTTSVDTAEKTSDDKPNEKKSDLTPIPGAFSIGSFLSRLDGIGSYNGIIFVATANSIEKLEPALYRNGRLDLMTFGYSRREDIISMIEKFYPGTKLNDSQIKRLPDRGDCIAPITVRKTIEMSCDCLDLLKRLEEMKVR